MDNSNRTLWIGNLSDEVTEELLYELFLQTGPIEQVRRPKDRDSGKLRPFAFITYKHEASVPYTMFVMDSITLFNRRLTIKHKTGSDQGQARTQAQNENYGLGLLPHPSFGKGVIAADLSVFLSRDENEHGQSSDNRRQPMQSDMTHRARGMPGVHGMGPGMMMGPPILPRGSQGMPMAPHGMPILPGMPMGPRGMPILPGMPMGSHGIPMNPHGMSMPAGPMGVQQLMMMGPGRGMSRSNTWHGDVSDMRSHGNRDDRHRDDRRVDDRSRDDGGHDRRHDERKRDRSPLDANNGRRSDDKRSRHDDQRHDGRRHGNHGGGGRGYSHNGQEDSAQQGRSSQYNNHHHHRSHNQRRH